MGEHEIDLSFSDLLIRLGITKPEAIVASHKIGRNLIGADLATVRFTNDEVDAISQLLADEVATTATTKEKKNKKRKTAKRKDPDAQWNQLKNKSVGTIAQFTGVSIEQVLLVCERLGIEVNDSRQNLKFTEANTVRNQIFIDELNQRQSDTEPAETNLLSQAKVVTAIEAKNRQQSVGRATTKRVEVIARESEVPLEKITFIIEALNIPRISGDKEKVSLHHEEDIKAALGLLDDLPQDRIDKGEVRLRSIIEPRNISPSAIAEFCHEKSIPLIRGKHLSLSNGLLLAWLLTDPALTAKLKRVAAPDPPADQFETLNTPDLEVETVNYQGVNLSRQNFSNYSFANAIMSSVNLGFCKLVDSDFTKAILDSADFARAICIRSNFSEVTGNNVSFERATLDHADFTGASLIDADFTGSSLKNTNFTSADFSNAIIEIKDLQSVVLNNTIWIDGRIINSVNEIAETQ